MAEVYLARDTKLGRRVALKVVQPDRLGSQGSIDRFLFEARATARFNHPHIVTIHFVGEVGGKPYVALEYLEGETLRRRLEQEELGVQETLRVGLAIAEALKEAHGADIVHRDLKPENVMLAVDGRLRVLDFGLAQTFSDQGRKVDLEEMPTLPDGELPGDETLAALEAFKTKSQGLRGTPMYMAPEQWQEQETTGATDIWALGLILYEAVARRRPYAEPTMFKQALAVTSDAPVPSVAQHAQVPRELSELIDRCLAKRPGQRPTAGELVGQLRALLGRDRHRPSKDESPFRGLLPFDERHRHLFFGRDSEIEAFVERLRVLPLLPVVGPSGAGKSSFIQAGVIPRLREKGPLDVIQLRPGGQPFQALALRITAARNPSAPSGEESPFGVSRELSDPGRLPDHAAVDDLAGRMRALPRLLNLELQKIADTHGSSVLLFVDQLEELCTLVDDGETRGAFMQAICMAADDPVTPVRVVFTLREEFLSRLAEERVVRDALGHITVLRSPGPEALEDTLVKPVEAVGHRYEDPDLVRQMVAELKGEVSCLPLLQFAGQMLWERRDKPRRVLPRRAYEEMGGVAGALARHADGVLAGLSTAEVQTARTILLRLVTSEGTRRVLSVDRVLDGLREGAGEILHKLTGARLITARQSETRDEAELELVHESLVATWGRLRRWLEESREELAFLEEINQAAELWDRRGRRDEEVWHGPAFRDALAAVEHCSTEISGKVDSFLAACRKREQQQQRRRRFRLVGGFGLLAAVALGAIIAALALAAKERETYREKQKAESRRAEAQLEGARGALVRGSVLEARAKLRSSLETQDSPLARALWWHLERSELYWTKKINTYPQRLAFSADGRTLAIGNHDRTVHLVDARTRVTRVLRGHEEQVYGVDLSPDGRLAASGSWDKTVRLWNVQQGTLVKRLEDHTDEVLSVKFSPDGRLLASGSADGTVRLWDVATRASLKRLEGNGEKIYRVGFSPDGKLLAAGSDSAIQLWDVASGRVVRRQTIHGACLAFDPEGRVLASGGLDGTVSLWDVASGARVRRIAAHTAPVRSVEFGPTGRYLASGDANGTIRVLDLRSKGRSKVFRGHTKEVIDLGFSPDGRLLASVSPDKTIRMWNVAAPSHDGRAQQRHTSAVSGLSFSPDGRTIATGSNDSTIRLWDVSTGVVLRVFESHGARVRPVRFFGPGGGLLASGGTDGTIRLWDVASGVKTRVLRAHTNEIWSVDLSPDGQLLASGSKDKTVRLWNAANGTAIRTLKGHLQDVLYVAFGPNGRVLASGSGDQTIRLWDVSTGRTVRVLRGHGGAVWGVAFGPDGRLLASGSADGTARLWDVQTGTVQAVRTFDGRVYNLAVHPRGTLVGAPLSSGTAHIWDLKRNTARVLEGHRSEVNVLRFSPDGKLAATVSDDGTVRTWRSDTGARYWRSTGLLARPPELLSHRGWVPLGSGATSPGARWRREIKARARLLAGDPTGRWLCAATRDGFVERWDRHEDRLLAKQRTAAARQILATPDACVTLLSSGAVLLHGTRARALVEQGATALSWKRGELLVAADRKILAFGPRRAKPITTDIGVTAVAGGQDWVLVGYENGSIEMIARGTGKRREGFYLESLPSSPVTTLVRGPMGILLAGYANGTLGIWDHEVGTQLHVTQLHGAVSQMLIESHKLFAVSDLGGHIALDLDPFYSGRCDFLREVWQRVPQVWEGGKVVLRSPPEGHPCLRPR
jgi:WD40 repeat protein/serine/threonine protein kinase